MPLLQGGARMATLPHAGRPFGIRRGVAGGAAPVVVVWLTVGSGLGVVAGLGVDPHATERAATASRGLGIPMRRSFRVEDLCGI